MVVMHGDFASFAKSHDASDLTVLHKIATLSTIPPLGSGKLDFAGVKCLVKQLEECKTMAA